MSDDTIHRATKGLSVMLIVLGVAFLGASAGIGISAVPVKSNFECVAFDTASTCAQTVGLLTDMSLTAFGGGVIGMALGGLGLWSIRGERDD